MVEGELTFRELLSDVKSDIVEVNSKIDDLDKKFDEHTREHVTHERNHALEQIETVRARSDPNSTPVNVALTKQIADLATIVKTHENRWQRIIGVLLVLTFLGVGSLGSILLLVLAVLNRLQPIP